MRARNGGIKNPDPIIERERGRGQVIDLLNIDRIYPLRKRKLSIGGR